MCNHKTTPPLPTSVSRLNDQAITCFIAMVEILTFHMSFYAIYAIPTKSLKNALNGGKRFRQTLHMLIHGNEML